MCRDTHNLFFFFLLSRVQRDVDSQTASTVIAMERKRWERDLPDKLLATGLVTMVESDAMLLLSTRFTANESTLCDITSKRLVHSHNMTAFHTIWKRLSPLSAICATSWQLGKFLFWHIWSQFGGRFSEKKTTLKSRSNDLWANIWLGMIT